MPRQEDEIEILEAEEDEYGGTVLSKEEKMACFKGFAQVFLISLNSIFSLLGLAMLGIGGYVMVEVKKYSGVIDSAYDAIPIFIICLGLFVFLLSFMGLFGACKENNCLNGTYAVILGILVLCQISAGIAGFVKKDSINELITKELEKSMQDWDVTNDVKGMPQYNVVAEAWNVIHQTFECSGTAGYTDWTNTTIMGDNSRFTQYITSEGWKKTDAEFPVPDSCCKTWKADDSSSNNCGWKYTSNDTIFTVGCNDKLDTWLEQNIAIIAGAAVGIAVIEMIGVMMACYIVKNKEDYDGQYDRHRYA